MKTSRIDSAEGESSIEAHEGCRLKFVFSAFFKIERKIFAKKEITNEPGIYSR